MHSWTYSAKTAGTFEVVECGLSKNVIDKEVQQIVRMVFYLYAKWSHGPNNIHNRISDTADVWTIEPRTRDKNACFT